MAVVAGALDGRQHVVGILHEVDVADDGTTHGASCRALTVPRQTEDGLADGDVWAVASDVSVELTLRHIPGNDLIRLAVDAGRLCHGGQHLAAFVHAVQPPQIA